MHNRYKVGSIFSGAGGLDLGFKNIGFESEFCVEFWDVACDTLKKNNMSKKIIQDDIRNVDFNSLDKDIDVLIGGPPCPPYSQTRHYLQGKKKGFEDENAGFAVPKYFEVVDIIRPKCFLFENVDGFAYKTHKEELEYVLKRAEELGYNVKYKVINCANYGIPQTRKRFFLVGTKKECSDYNFPKETHSKKGEDRKKIWVNCGEVIGDFDDITTEEMQQKPGAKYNYLLKNIPPGDNYLFYTEKRGYKNPIFKWKSRYWTFLLKLTPDRPSWTIQASFSNNQGPFHWKNRFLRISEIKRLQTFSDDYHLCGDFKEQWRQIGNAVPPLMSEILAESIKKYLDDNGGKLNE